VQARVGVSVDGFRLDSWSEGDVTELTPPIEGPPESGLTQAGPGPVVLGLNPGAHEIVIESTGRRQVMAVDAEAGTTSLALELREAPEVETARPADQLAPKPGVAVVLSPSGAAPRAEPELRRHSPSSSTERLDAATLAILSSNSASWSCKTKTDTVLPVRMTDPSRSGAVFARAPSTIVPFALPRRQSKSCGAAVPRDASVKARHPRIFDGDTVPLDAPPEQERPLRRHAKAPARRSPIRRGDHEQGRLALRADALGFGFVVQGAVALRPGHRVLALAGTRLVSQGDREIEPSSWAATPSSASPDSERTGPTKP
jgi:hypothetical protein